MAHDVDDNDFSTDLQYILIDSILVNDLVNDECKKESHENQFQ